MKLSELLWENWSTWAEGGLNAASIEEHLEPQDREMLLRWLDHAYQTHEQVRPLLNIKIVIDIATWILYGTHFDLLPREMRLAQYTESAHRWGLTTDVLFELFKNRGQLPER